MAEQIGSPQNSKNSYMRATKYLQNSGGKSVSPLSQPRLSHNAIYTNSTKDLHATREQIKVLKIPGGTPSFIANKNNKYETTSPKNVYQNGNPTYYDGKRQGKNAMKSSMLLDKNQTQAKTYQSGIQPFGNGSMGEPQNAKRTPRMSQQPDMKSSSIQLGSSPKAPPSFLQNKHKEAQRKAPYTHQNSRPQSSNQAMMFKSVLPPDTQLSTSYGNMKKSKIEQSNPVTKWSERSWSKKKKMTIEDFQQIKQLGTGKYGQVFLARQKRTQFICAIKIIEKKLLIQEDITEQFIREVKIQQFLNHPNIIRMYSFFDDKDNIYLLLQVAMGGQLFKQLKKLQSMAQKKVAEIMRQVCQAVNQLHSHQIIHRDIKPQNIVLHQNVIKLCDFGWSVYRDNKLSTTFCGTPLYVGPEILKGNEYDQKIDIWSLGVMMYEMLVGENPFKITKQEELIKIIKDEIKIPSYVTLSAEAHSFLFACLQKDPQHRLSIRQLLAHDFFKKYPEKSDKKMGI